MEIVAIIKDLCKNSGVSLSKLEREIGLTANSIYRWDASFPSIDKVIKVAQYFGVSLDYLCGISEIKEPAIAKDSGRVIANRLGKLDDQDLELVFRVAEQLRDNPEAMRSALGLALAAVQSSSRSQ